MFLKNKKPILFGISFIALAILLYLFVFKSDSSNKNYYVIEEVSKGDVYSGITASGSIVAAQKLNLNIYKKTNRIDEVNIVNGQKIEKGDVLFSFDSSDISVDLNKYSLNASEAKLDISEQKIKNSLENSDEVNLSQSIYDIKQKIENAKRDYFSIDFEAVAQDDNMLSRPKPKVSGEYISEQVGYYDIDIYSSAAESGYSFRYSGLESGNKTIYLNEELSVGTRGVLITFTSDIKNGDLWRISLPNTNSNRSYSNKIDFENLIKSYESQLTIAEQNLATIKRTNTSTYKNINVQKAELSLRQANQSLSEQYELLDERIVVAPFSGTIEGIENLVEGATPTNGTDDPVKFGTLISDTFYVNFSLNATEIASVSVGQKVIVTVSSSKGQETLNAEIVEISSLPESSTTPQYEVNALIQLNSESTIQLREGILADIEIVEEEKKDVVRVPNSSLQYRGKQASVLLIPKLNKNEQTIINEFGVLEQQDTSFESYRVNVQVGILGQFFTEIISGVNDGDSIIVSSSTTSSESVVKQEGHTPGSGEGPGRKEA